MKILVLTSINPLLATDPFIKVTNHFSNIKVEPQEKISFLCYPFFAEIARVADNKEYLPTVFSMMQASMKPNMNKKLFKEKNVVLFGNTYKNQKFDMIISYEDLNSEVFDNYVEMIKHEEGMEPFAELVAINHLYTLDDSEYQFKTLDHLILFLEEAFNVKK